jgi:hypothetical protein
MAKAVGVGRVAEWFKALVLKTSDGATRPWVRIPPLPPVFQWGALNGGRASDICWR